MKSPLEQDKATVAKYKIPEFVDPSPLQKIAFLQDQLEQIQSMHWRARTDMLHAQRMIDQDDNPILKNKGLQNIEQHRNEMEQSIGAIIMLRKFIDELREEYPELQIEK